jgi:hypothetical protein
MSPGTDVGSIARGIAFLARAQQADGGFLNLFHYRDMPPIEVGNVFPAALIAHSLSFAPEGQAVAARALDFLAAEASPEGVWQHWSSGEPHQFFLPPDVDDTACASAALRRGCRPVPGNEALLFANRNRRGLFYTWFTWRPRWSGWQHFRLVWPQRRHLAVLWPMFTRTTASIHNVDAVVNANALFYLGERAETVAIPPYLVDVLAADGEEECDTWYPSRFVVWYFFSRALAPARGEAARLMRSKLEAAAPRSPLDMAAVQCARLDWQMPADEAITALLEGSQLPSGAWPAEHLYRGKDCYWGSEAVTTGFVVEALARARTARAAQ